MAKYTVIYELAADGGYYAHIPALDLTTEGDTLDEAKEWPEMPSKIRLPALKS